MGVEFAGDRLVAQREMEMTQEMQTTIGKAVGCGGVLLCGSLAGGEMSDNGAKRNAAPAFSIASVLQDRTALDQAHDVEVAGNRMFVPGKGGALAIVDVRRPDSPTVTWSETVGDDEQTVLCRDGHVFVGTRDFLSLTSAILRRRNGANDCVTGPESTRSTV